MPDYRLIFPNEPEGTGQSVSFAAADAAEALILAQGHNSPAQLWLDGRHLCTLSRSGAEGVFWIIS